MQDLWEGTEKRERAGGRLVLVLLLVLALLLAGGYAAAALAAGDKVPRGTTVSGVDIGGLSQTDAERRLEEDLAERAAAPIEVSVVGSDPVSLDPDEIGLSVDYAASVAAAGGEQTWDPRRLWDYYTGGDDLDAVVDVDDDALQAALADLGTDVGTPPRNGAIKFTQSGVTTRDPEVGKAVDPATAADAVVAAYLEEDASVDLELSDAQPEIDEGDVRDALDSFANPAMSGPVTLIFDKSRVRLSPREYAGALAMQPHNGELVPTVDAAELTDLVKGATSGKGKPVDATVKLVNGKPRVVPSKPGVTFDPDDITTTFLDLVAMPEGERKLEVEATVDEADFTTRDARNLNIREKVSEFTTYFPYAEYRNTNIGRAAELVDGTVLKPGETFSLNGVVGERTVENGFTTGFVISGGIFKEDLGGGVSQMATTTFNAMFFAGLKDIEHKPHSFYIDRYPVGREATVAWPSVDLRFQNDTKHGILIHSWVNPSTPSSQGSVTVQMYSTKVWDISSSNSERYAFVGPGTRTLDTPDCYPNTGYSGFQIDVTRTFRKHGESAVDHTETFHTTYTPADTVICKPPGSLDEGQGNN
ncbi:MAG TPA: VanW family protein [Nocardioides sp.]|nr:VanW family protein [Nocardioides sp.]